MLSEEEVLSNFLYAAENDISSELKERLLRRESYVKINPFGLIKPGYNQYLIYLEMLKQYFGLNCNILEVGGGLVPIFAKYIAHEQLKTGSGTITVYDPRLLSCECKGYSNMLLHKEPVTGTTDISKYDLVVGIMPCLGTDVTLKLIEEYKKNFFIALCGCDHNNYGLESYDKYGYRPSYNDYIIEAKRICEEKNLGELVIDYLPGSTSINNPIIYNKRKHG